MTVDVVIPTLKRAHAFTCLSLLRHIPWPINLHLIVEGKSWSEAVNIGLAESKNDVILMDDDVFLCPDTFSLVEQYYNDADIFGFKLFYPSGDIQHAGGTWRDGQILHIGHGQPDGPEYRNPYFTCHLTTSLVYIKRAVLDKIGGMATDYPGMQFEDVDFNFRALKAGFKLLFLPGPAVHLESASKKWIPGFQSKLELSYAELKSRYGKDTQLWGMLASLPRPLAPLEVR